MTASQTTTATHTTATGRSSATIAKEHRTVKTQTCQTTSTLALAAALALGFAAFHPSASHAQTQTQATKAAKAPITVENQLPAGRDAKPIPSRPRQAPAGAEDPNWVTSAYVNSYIEYYGNVDDWTFTVGRYDSYVLIQMNRFSGNLDPFISIYDPWGRLMFSNDDANPYTLNSAIQFRAPWQGTYTVRTRSLSFNEVGGYTLWVYRSNLPISF